MAEIRWFLPLVLACSAGLPSLAQAPDPGVSVAVDTVMGFTPGVTRNYNTMDGKVGMGLEASWAASMGEIGDLRLNVAFCGLRTATWADENPDTYETRDIHEYWRNLRFGAEHAVRLGRGPAGHGYVFYGAGIQETWVARTTGNLLGVALTSLFNGTFGGYVDYTYRQYTSNLDSWSGYVTAGAGFRWRNGFFLEVRGVSGNHQEFALDGISTTGSGYRENRRGVLVLVALGMSSR